MADLTREEQAGGGWKLVPVEPTEAMVNAHFAAHAAAETVFASVPEMWAAMLAAAPQSPSPAEVGASPVVVPGAMPPHPLLYPNAEWCEEYSRWHGRYIRAVLADSRHDAVTGKVRAALPPPPADLVGELVGALRLATGYFGKPTNGWAPLRDDDQVELTVRVRIGDLKAMNAALDRAAQAEARANG
jgi:hypothetical protein